MTRKGGFLNATFVYTFANIVNAAIPFLLLPVLTRVLTPNDYGVVAMFGIVITIFGVVAGVCVHGAVGVRYFDRQTINFPRFVASCLLVLILSTLIVLATVLAFQGYLVEITSVPLTWLVCAVFVAGAQFVIQIRLSIWLSERQPWKYAALQIGQSAFNAGLSLFLVLGFGMAWEGRLIGNTAAVFLFAILAYWGLSNGGWIKYPPSKEGIRSALNFGIPLMPHTAGAVALSVADRFIITNAMGLEASGIYTVAFQLAMSLGLLADSFSKAYNPWLYEMLHKNTQEARLRIVGFTYISFFAFIVFFICAWCVLSLAFNLLVPNAYADARNLLGWLLLGHAIKGMYFAVAGLFFFKSMTGQLSKITVSVGVVQVLLISYSVHFTGLEGVAMSFAIACAILFISAWKISASFVDLPWSKFSEAIRSIRPSY